MGVGLVLRRIDPDRLAAAIERAVAAGRRLGLQPPTMGASWPARVLLRLRYPLRYPLVFRTRKAWLDAYADRVFGPWQRSLETESAEAVDLGESWRDFAVVSDAWEWAGEWWRGAPPDAGPLARAVHGTHTPPDEMRSGMGSPVRFNTPEEVGWLSAALPEVDLESRIAAFDVDAVPPHIRPSWIEPDGTRRSDRVDRLLGAFDRLQGLYLRAACEGESVVCELG